MANTTYGFLTIIMGMLAYAFGGYGVVADMTRNFVGDEVSTLIILLIPIALLAVIITNNPSRFNHA
jgi:hypothetical protein